MKRLQTPKIRSFKEPNRLQRYTFYQKVSTPPVGAQLPATLLQPIEGVDSATRNLCRAIIYQQSALLLWAGSSPSGYHDKRGSYKEKKSNQYWSPIEVVLVTRVTSTGHYHGPVLVG